MDGYRDCSEWSKSDRGEISYDVPYVQNLKRNDTNELPKQKLTDLENKLLVAKGEGQREAIGTEFGIGITHGWAY